MTMDDLRASIAADAGRVDLVRGLIRERSLNLLVGDSGLGKTPWLIQLALAVAAGVPFLGRTSRRGRILYLDGESDRQSFRATVDTITAYLKLPAPIPPEQFLVWSPNWTEVDRSPADGLMLANVAKVDLCIVDTLRVFGPDAESKPQETMKLFRKLRAMGREHGTSWVISHHVRKTSQHAASPDLSIEPLKWLEEASGTKALITGSDLRLGVEARADYQRGDLMACGLLRGVGQIGPLYLDRAQDAAGDPVGYVQLQGVDLLSQRDREVFNLLHSQFRHADAVRLLHVPGSKGTSGSNGTRFIKRCLELDLIEKVGDQYRKIPLTGVWVCVV